MFDTMTLTKIGGALCGALLVFLLGNWAAEIVYSTESDGHGDEVAQAYVIAHEIGHHVQNLVGVLPEYSRAIQSMSEEEANAYSVQIELQADCYAGIWASYVGEENLLDDGDVEEAINAAEQIGDDAIQSRTQGVVIPKTFTHGTSAQRQEWFERGYATGDVGECDTFSGAI